MYNTVGNWLQGTNNSKYKEKGCILLKLHENSLLCIWYLHCTYAFCKVHNLHIHGQELVKVVQFYLL